MPRNNNSRRASGEGNIRQRADGNWEARYTLGTNPGTGKPIRKSIYGKTQAEVLKKLREVQSSIDKGTYSEPTKMTVSNWMGIWLKEYLRNVKDATMRSYSDIVKNHINPELGAILLSKLNSPTIQKFYNNLQNGCKNKLPLSPKTIKNIHGILHSALKQAVSIGYIRFNPSEACVLPRIEKKDISFISDDKLKDFLVTIKGNKFEVLFFVDIFTGMRKGEILGITWKDIDFEKGTIYVNKQLQREKKIGGEYKLVSLKNDKARKITPAHTVMERLKSHRIEQIKNKLRCGSLWCNEWDLVFTNEIGQHLNHYTVWKHFKKAISNIGLEEVRFHDLRHSYAVTALQCGNDIKTVQENLGHYSSSFTLDIYGHVSDTMRNESAKQIDSHIKNLIV